MPTHEKKTNMIDQKMSAKIDNTSNNTREKTYTDKMIQNNIEPVVLFYAPPKQNNNQRPPSLRTLPCGR